MMLPGVACVVVGSAPLATPLQLSPAEYVVAVNGGISSVPGLVSPDRLAWMLNARTASDATVIGRLRDLHALMLQQGAGRSVDRVLLLEKQDGAAEHTLKRLDRQRTVYAAVTPINAETRRVLETRVGARGAEMAKHALSAGLTAAAWCLSEGAQTVRLEGFSWTPGYAYTDTPIVTRGHEAGDKAALRRLLARYPERLIQSLIPKEGTVMAKSTPGAARGRRSTPESRTQSRSARQRAKEALTPASERERKTETKEAERAAASTRRPSSLMVVATEKTFYNNRRIRVGDVFQLRDRSDFRESCMAWVKGADHESVPSKIENDATRMRAAHVADLESGVEAEEERVENERVAGKALEKKAAAESPAGRPTRANPLGV